MKKNLLIAAVAGIFMIPVIGCGPSAEEKAAAEKAQQDSINAVMEQKMAEQKQAIEDSLANVKAAEEEAARQKQAMEDSIKAAVEKENAAAKPKSAPKPKSEPKKEPAPEAPKVGKKKPGANP